MEASYGFLIAFWGSRLIKHGCLFTGYTLLPRCYRHWSRDVTRGEEKVQMTTLRGLEGMFLALPVSIWDLCCLRKHTIIDPAHEI